LGFGNTTYSDMLISESDSLFGWALWLDIGLVLRVSMVGSPSLDTLLLSWSNISSYATELDGLPSSWIISVRKNIYSGVC